MAGKNYSILVDVELDTSNIQKQLDRSFKNTKIDLGTKNAVEGMDELNASTLDTYLTFQAANEIFSKSIEIIEAMVEQVYALNEATIEFQKVSDLSGTSLDNYITKLSEMGDAVARTGKPKCQAPDDGMVNQHRHPLEIQYNLRAYSTTMVT